MDVRLIVGLGNPGRIYRNTWHNLGATVVEKLASKWSAQFLPGKGDFIYADVQEKGRKITLLIPTSYMNRSGGPVSQWLRYYKVAPEKALVIFDDHDLPLGRIRIRTGGSSGGHRGMDDIIRLVGTEKIPRIKIGIRIDSEKKVLARQVLSNIPGKFRDGIESIVDTTIDAVEKVIVDGIISAMNTYNKLEIES